MANVLRQCYVSSVALNFLSLTQNVYYVIVSCYIIIAWRTLVIMVV